MVAQGAACDRVWQSISTLQRTTEQVLKAGNFDEAFGLRQKKGLHSRKKPRGPGEGFELKEFAWDMIHMGRDHEFPTHALPENS